MKSEFGNGICRRVFRASQKPIVRLEANVAQLEKLTGATLTRFDRKDMGFSMCISWEAGLEVVAPMEKHCVSATSYP